MSWTDVYIDGACFNNGQPNARAGVGVWFGPNHPENVSRPLQGRQTNQRAEIHAAIDAANIARRRRYFNLRIFTDSDYLSKSIESWMANWKANGWRAYDGKPVENKQDFLELDRVTQPLNIDWNFVPAHSGITGNEEADRLAKAGARMHNNY